jgi:hypothetical protein
VFVDATGASIRSLPLPVLTPDKTQKRRSRKLDHRKRKRRRSIKFPMPVVTGRPHRRKSLSQFHGKQSSVEGTDPCNTSLLSDVNLLFLIHMAQEQQQRTGAKDQGKSDRRNAFPHPGFVLANEPEEENVNSSEQGDQTNN